jgi:MoaA/NifB/PqqE/SkfB family radical SAM enzyme/SAM-dependent methyltransferase
MSKTACVVPWSMFIVAPDGRAMICCDIPDPLTIEGRMGSVYRDSLDDLWNAPERVELRAALARGEKPEVCRVCWEREAAGGVSRRLTTNAAYRHVGGQLSIEGLSLEGNETGYRLERRPDWFVLHLGNACDLKCRSCNPLSSSSVAADRLHAEWSLGTAATSETAAVQRRRLRIVPEDSSPWFSDVNAMADMIASGAEGNAALTLVGGEPFLTERAWQLLSALVGRGVAPRLYVTLTTNGQHRSERLEQLAPQFRNFYVSVSIDGHGRLYEYLRHGASWRRLVENLRGFRRVPGLTVTVTPTLQNYNALGMVTLLRFLDEHDLKLVYNVLDEPARLRPTNLPPSVRRIAAARLRHYLDAECRPENHAVVRTYCQVLEEAGDDFDARLFDEFMAFTNDLDADRGESLREAAPELVALVRAAGVEWSDVRRHVSAKAFKSPLRSAELLRRVNRTTVSPDMIFESFEADRPGSYFSSALHQLAEIDERLREHGHEGLAGVRAVADFACHYGRMTRVLRAALPHAAVYACDIDRDAVRFCSEQLGALPVVTGWQPDEESLPTDLDAVVCVSLLTHTPLEHWRRVLRAWERTLRPGGVAAFTFLSEGHADAWLAGEMRSFGDYSGAQRAAATCALRGEGFGFASLTSGYGDEPFYGIAFSKAEVVRREVAAAGLELLWLSEEVSPTFAQNLVLARKPNNQSAMRDEQSDARAAAPEVLRDVSLVAFYDPRCYAPPEGGEEGHAESVWVRLTSANPPRPLPTELGFGDPRVPEVREAQAALAREHGLDAFCYLYFWGAAGPRWDAPWRDLVATGRPDFPFCLMLALEDGALVSAADARRLFDDIAPGLRDRRYLRVEGRPLLIVRDVTRLGEPRLIAAEWRAAAAESGLGELHLCAAETARARRPEDLRFDSFLQSPMPDAEQSDAVATALARPWPQYRFFRTVECRRDAATHSVEMYEQWLHTAIDATRSYGESLVFVDSWNDWLRGRYLEPDDRDGRASLLATRRAARGSASGLVLLRRLRDVLGEVEGTTAATLGELEQVLALHERARDRLTASVEAALGCIPQRSTEAHRAAPIRSQLLPASGGAVCLDLLGDLAGKELLNAEGPIHVRGETLRLAGWAFYGGGPTTGLNRRAKAAVNRFLPWVAKRTSRASVAADLFLVLEASEGTEDHFFPVAARVERPDVAAAFPGCPVNCGFDAVLNLSAVPPGTYRVAVVQSTPHSAYRDLASVVKVH